MARPRIQVIPQDREAGLRDAEALTAGLNLVPHFIQVEPSYFGDFTLLQF